GYLIACFQYMPFIQSRQGVTMPSLVLWLSAALPGLLWASQSALLVEGDKNASRICKLAPYWDIKGRSPMQEQLGNVVVVALLKAS
ncbi:Selenoprotein Pb, partial [Goodea atripinnis]